MPLAPNLCGSEHTTFSAHVAEGSLTGAMGTTTRDTRDTGHGTTCTTKSIRFAPGGNISLDGLCAYQFPKIRQKSVHQPSRSRRTLVFCSWPCRCAHFGRHHCQNINFKFRCRAQQRDGERICVRSDGRVEDGGERVRLPGGRAIAAEDADGGTGRHLCGVVGKVRWF
jgi:hypothetical protein